MKNSDTPATPPTLFNALFGRLRPATVEGKAEASFHSNPAITLGLELELQVIDAKGLGLAPRAVELLAALPSSANVKPELYLDMIELNTGICTTVHEAGADLRATLKTLRQACAGLGLELASTGSHPLSGYSESGIYPAARYNALIDRNQWLTRRWKVYGLHVHLGMENGDQCIRFNNFFLHLLPHLLALSASAPFWQGHDTGLATCRPTMYEALPTAGMPYFVQSYAEFVALCEHLRKCEAIHSLKDLWWDVRPSPAFGTLEIRVCDSPATLAETLAIVAFIHSLALWFRDHGDWLSQVPQPAHWLMRENKWRVIRHGLEARLVLSNEGESRPIRDDILSWIAKLTPVMESLGYESHRDLLRQICISGSSATRQRAIYAASKALNDVVAFNIREFKEGEPLWQERNAA